VWIKRPGREVQGRGLWDSPRIINRAACCATWEVSHWENPVRISGKFSIQVWLSFVNGLLRFKNSERIVARLPHPLMSG
jgi:hypothetical protein